MIEIRKALPSDHDGIWSIIYEVISKGDTYVFLPGTPRQQMMDYWCGNDKNTYVTLIDNVIAGTFILKNNQPGLGSHIANGSYMASSKFSGQGVGIEMGRFSIEEAKRLDYKAIQFNIVIKSNERAVSLWKKLGFEIIGEIPEAFNHQQNGLTNAYIMYRKL